MKELTKEQQSDFDEINKNIGETLIKTMYVLDIPNFIEASYICDGYRYKLRFDKEKIEDE